MFAHHVVSPGCARSALPRAVPGICAPVRFANNISRRCVTLAHRHASGGRRALLARAPPHQRGCERFAARASSTGGQSNDEQTPAPQSSRHNNDAGAGGAEGGSAADVARDARQEGPAPEASESLKRPEQIKRRRKSMPAMVTMDEGGMPSTKPSSFKPVAQNQGPVVGKGKIAKLVAFLKDKLVLTALLGIWYASNIFYNIYNKQVLKVFPLPTSCTFMHLLTASALMGALWLFRMKKTPEVNKRLVNEVVPLSVMHLLGFLFTNMSLGAVNVSLTHTIKSMEPFFTVVLSYFFLGSVPSIPIILTLVPIVAGVVVASATDLSFNWYGFTTAMGSNLMFQSRNVISKKYMVESSLESLEDGHNFAPLDEVNLFACISVAATVLMVPVMLVLDGPTLLARWEALGANMLTFDVFLKTVLAGICRTGDVLASYSLLSRLNPVTHSVSNCVKRVVVIVVSLVFFKTPASMLNVIGTALALSGVFAYSMAKRMTKTRPDLKASLQKKSPLTVERLIMKAVPDPMLAWFAKARKVRVQELRDEQNKPEYEL
mmetsp:Transcript_31494/g.59206  ORF Transcript_31494/g.59206 Transcript_31494/m.59206 type:complete len:547 (-) Transcript_31494:250-1890(-)